MRKLRKIAALTTILVAITAGNAQAADSHQPPRGGKPVWEHTTDVYRFFRNHHYLMKYQEAHRQLRLHAQLAYKALIWKWDGVHACEGPWHYSGYYDGGLQMDDQFQRSYGREFIGWWGHAGQWPPWAQMTVAERAYRSGRGFGPWPVCGAYGG